MLKKFVSIKNVGTFRSSAAHGNIELRRLSLVHAENGRGKTTICAILRSLQGGEPNHILERRTLDSTDAPFVEVLLDTGLVVFKDAKWSATCGNIEIFDAAFVADNVYSGDFITHDHKKNLCRVILGAKGVSLAKAFDACDDQVKACGAEFTAARDVLAKIAPKSLTVEQFTGLPSDPAIEEKIGGKKAELALVADAETVRTKPALNSLVLPEPPPTLAATLHKGIDGVSSEAEQLIHEHVKTHKMGSRGEAWLGEGLRFDAATDCPFCAQSLGGSPVIQAFRTYFSEAYRSFRQALDAFKTSVDRSLGDAALLAIQKRIAENASLIEFWKKHVAADIPMLSFDDRVEPTLRTLRDAISPLVAAKLASPLERVELTEAAQAAVAAWNALQSEVCIYNDKLTQFNLSVVASKTKAVAKPSATLQGELVVLEAQRLRYTPAAIEAVKAHGDSKAKKAAAEAAKEKAKEALDTYNVTVIAKYRVAVNALLGRFGAAFTLAAVKMEYTGRTPRTAYTFEIRGKEVDPGSDKTPAGAACFRNTLSAGDRNTLALAFFFAQLRSRTDLASCVVVFDDPFTSLDSFRQTWTCNILRKLSTEAKQVLVLSHSLEFLRLLADRVERAALSTLKIDRHNRIDSHIIELDLDDATATAVDRDVVQLRSYYLGDDMDSTKTVRCIRPLLENHIRRTAPDQCPPDNGWLGTFLGEIERANATSPLSVFKPIYDELDYLNGYTSPYAHDSGTAPQINEQELATAAEMTLKLIGRL